MFINVRHLPRALIQSVIIPLVKCKSGNLSDVNNYTAIAIATAMSKILENVTAESVFSFSEIENYQFGFKTEHSTGICSQVFKQNYYVNQGSHVFACFVDFQKAFDYVNYWKLFIKLLRGNIDANIVGMLADWYSRQELCVRWISTMLGFFMTSNGTRQDSVLSPFLFCRYIRDLLQEIVQSGIGCNIVGIFMNILAYANDIVLLAPAWRAMQALLVILEKHTDILNMSCNVNKTVCMVFQPKRQSQVVSESFPQLTLCSFYIKYVDSFKYLGHIILSNRMDNDDIQREVHNLLMRTSMLPKG